MATAFTPATPLSFIHVDCLPLIAGARHFDAAGWYGKFEPNSKEGR